MPNIINFANQVEKFATDPSRATGRFSDWDDGQEDHGVVGRDEEDLWFLPGPEEEEDDVPPGFAPLPRENRDSLFEVADWRAAQNALSAELAQLT